MKQKWAFFSERIAFAFIMLLEYILHLWTHNYRHVTITFIVSFVILNMRMRITFWHIIDRSITYSETRSAKYQQKAQLSQRDRAVLHVIGESVDTISYSQSIVTMALSCMISETKRDIGWKSWPWNVGQRSLKVIEISAIRKLGCGFLVAFYSNYGRICSRLWDIQCQRMAWPWKPG